MFVHLFHLFALETIVSKKPYTRQLDPYRFFLPTLIYFLSYITVFIPMVDFSDLSYLNRLDLWKKISFPCKDSALSILSMPKSFDLRHLCASQTLRLVRGLGPP